MAAIVLLEKRELAKRPGTLSEVKLYCHAVIEEDDRLILEPKSGYLTPLTMAVSRQNLSYDVVFQDQFTREELSKVLANHS